MSKGTVDSDAVIMKAILRPSGGIKEAAGGGFHEAEAAAKASHGEAGYRPPCLLYTSDAADE